MTLQIVDAHAAACSVKSALPEAVTVVGGYYVSAAPLETLQRFHGFDAAVHGEGEQTIRDRLSGLSCGSALSDLAGIKGLGVRIDGEPVPGPEREFIVDLDSLRFPAFELMPMERYAGFYTFFFASRRTAPLSTGRGCPYKCIFCFKATGEKYRTRSITSVMDEMKRDAADFGVSEFVITDESFLTHRNRVVEFCDALQSAGLKQKPTWVCQGRVDQADPDTLRLMKRAGCRVISYGVESGSPEMLKRIKKGITLERVGNAIRWTREAGILTDTNYIIGHPWDTRETINDTIYFAVKSNAHMASFAILVPFPGTEIARMALQGEGGLKLLSTDYSTYGKQVGGAMELDDIPRQDLERFHRKAYMKFYLRPSRILSFMRVVDLRMMVLIACHTLMSKLRKSKS